MVREAETDHLIRRYPGIEVMSPEGPDLERTASATKTLDIA